MFNSKTIANALFIVAATIVAVDSSAEDCKKNFGPVPTTATCDRYTNLGTSAHLDNKPTDNLNTAVDDETSAETFSRLNGLMPPQDPTNIKADYNPVFDAYCFNEDYPVPVLTSTQQSSLYNDYKRAFDKINEFTTDVSVENNRVTNNRIPGMFLRMCFH
jgi:hypothetical protein